MGFLVKKCCFCVELTTSAMLLGWASLVLALATILLCVLGIVYADVVASHFHKETFLNHEFDVEESRKSGYLRKFMQVLVVNL
jgi:hypothetical protein